MKTALTALLESKKFWTTIIGIITTAFGAWLAKHGFDMSDAHTAQVAQYLSLGFLTLLGGQAATDFGKEKAKLETARDVAYLDAPATKAAEGNGLDVKLADASKQDGYVRIDVLFGLFLAGGVFIGATLTACGWLKSETKKTASDVVDCTTSKAVAAVGEFKEMAKQVVVDSIDSMGKPDVSRLSTVAKTFSAGVGGCVMQAAVKEVVSLVDRAGGVMSASAPVDRDALEQAWSKIAADQFGRKYQ